MAPPTVVGFDLDGTLFDHEQAARRAIASFVTDRGWPLAPDIEDRWIRLEYVHFGAYAQGRIGFHEQRRLRMGALLSALAVDAPGHEIDDLFAEYFVHYREHWVAYPDTVPALDRLSDMGLVLAVLTNGQQGLQTEKLERMGVLDRFDVVLAASELPAFKPQAAAFDALCRAVGASAPEVAFVGDDLAADVGGAAAAGLRPVWIDRAGAGGGPDDVLVVRSLDELDHVAIARL